MGRAAATTSTAHPTETQQIRNWHYAILLVASALLFGQTISFDFVPYDDPVIVAGNGYVNQGVSLKGLVWAFTYQGDDALLAHQGVKNLWHPLTWVSHMVDVQLFGLRPAAHHLSNWLLHTLLACQSCLLASRLTRNAGVGLLCGLLLLCHPLRVESVAWVSERKDVLSGVFFLASLLSIERGKRRAGAWFYLAAMLSKPSTVILPLIAILMLGWQADERRWGLTFWRNQLDRWWRWLLGGLLVSAVTIYFQGQGTHSDWIASIPLQSRLLTLGQGLLFYLYRVLYPVDLTFHYAYPESGLGMLLSAWLAILLLVAGLWSRRENAPNAFFAAAWFAVCLFPASGIFYVGTSFTADRYLYLALIGPCIVLARWTLTSSPHPGSKPDGQRARLRLAMVGLLTLAAAGLTIVQTATWRNGWSLFRHAVAVQPDNPVALVNLGLLEHRAKNYPQAITLYQRAVATTPSHAIAWFNLGNSLRDNGQKRDAIEAFQQATRWSPGYAAAWKNLGLVLRSINLTERDPQAIRDAFAHAVEHTQRRDPISLQLLLEAEQSMHNSEQARTIAEELNSLRANRHP